MPKNLGKLSCGCPLTVLGYTNLITSRDTLMALLKPNAKATKEQVRINIDKGILSNVKSYVEWAGLDKVDDFFEQAAQHILAKDKDWKEANKAK